MAHVVEVESRRISDQDIKELAGASGTCLTLLLPAHVPGAKRTLAARLKAAAVKSEERLAERSIVSTLVRKLVDPITEAANHWDNEAGGETLVIFSTEQAFRLYWSPQTLEETITAADNILIRPFLDDIAGEKEFYILALSQNDIRLLRCNEHSAEEVELGSQMAHSLLENIGSEKPEQILGNRSSAGPSSGNSKGVMFSTNADNDKRDEYLLHFYKDVSKRVTELLKGQPKMPLVVCGVEYELAIYKTVDQYPNTCPHGVKGAPNGLKGGEMHSRALECLDKMREGELQELLLHHDKQSGDAATAGVNEIVKAAHEGRVQHLLVASNGHAMGNFDEASHRARTHQVPRSGDECLINAAAVQTILHGGDVRVMPQARVPGNRPMAAIMRY